MTDPRYPIGRFVARGRASTAEEREVAIQILAAHPSRVRATVEGLGDERLHGRWVRLVRTLSPEDFGRPLRHPEIGDVTLDFLLEMYAWHARHHEAHLAAAAAAEV